MTTITEDDIAKIKFRALMFLDQAQGGFVQFYESVDYPVLRAARQRSPGRKTVHTTYWVGDVECPDKHSAAKALTLHLRDLEWDAAAPKERTA
jgi:hypothetical protein